MRSEAAAKHRLACNWAGWAGCYWTAGVETARRAGGSLDLGRSWSRMAATAASGMRAPVVWPAAWHCHPLAPTGAHCACGNARHPAVGAARAAAAGAGAQQRGGKHAAGRGRERRWAGSAAVWRVGRGRGHAAGSGRQSGGEAGGASVCVGGARRGCRVERALSPRRAASTRAVHAPRAKHTPFFTRMAPTHGHAHACMQASAWGAARWRTS